MLDGTGNPHMIIIILTINPILWMTEARRFGDGWNRSQTQIQTAFTIPCGLTQSLRIHIPV